MRVIDQSAINPGYVKSFCQHWFDHIEVGYVPSIGKVQIACFDGDGTCRMCVRYQWNYSGIWFYEVVPGFRYREPEQDE